MDREKLKLTVIIETTEPLDAYTIVLMASEIKNLIGNHLPKVYSVDVDLRKIERKQREVK